MCTVCLTWRVARACVWKDSSPASLNSLKLHMREVVARVATKVCTRSFSLSLSCRSATRIAFRCRLALGWLVPSHGCGVGVLHTRSIARVSRIGSSSTASSLSQPRTSHSNVNTKREREPSSVQAVSRIASRLVVAVAASTSAHTRTAFATVSCRLAKDIALTDTTCGQ